MELRHGGLIIDLPSGWSDQSTLLFLAPRAPDDDVAEAVSIKFALDAPPNARDLLEQQAAQLRQVDPTFEVTDEGPFECGLGEGWRFTQRLSLEGVVLLQVSVVVVISTVAVIATAAAGERRFRETEAQLRTILQSMRAVGADT